MVLEITNREEFLINLVLYLQGGNGLENKKFRSQSEIESILNDEQMFKDIDVINDELNYFGLEINDFVWNSKNNGVNNMEVNTIDFNEEYRIANEYFYHSLIEIADIHAFEDSIKDLLKFLNENNFSIKDVLNFYKLSDLQDEFDIIRLMEFLEITDDPNKHCSIDEIVEQPLASNKNGYLIITDNEEE